MQYTSSKQTHVQVQQLVEAAAPTLTYAVDHITKEKCGDLYNKKCSDAAHKE